MPFRRSILASAVLGFSILATPCQCQEQQAFGGTAIDRNEYLWFSAIGVGAEHSEILCSGALISPWHVVTADHCLDDKAINSLWVRVGYFCPRSDNCSRPFRARNVMEIRRNPSLGDIAILVLSAKAPSIFVPAIPDVGSPSYLSSVEKGGEMLMVGAGRDGTSEMVAKRAEKLKLQLEHKKYQKCRDAIRNEEARKELVSKATICSLSDEGKPCQGDSGSAILVEGVDAGGGDVIVAIHNYGPIDCSGADNDVFFGHLALSAVADFVISVVCVGDEKEPWCPSTSCQVPSPPPPSPSAPRTCTAEDCAPLLSASVCARFISADACAPFVSLEVCAPLSPSLCPPSLTLAPVQVLKGDSLQATLLHDLTDHSNRVYSATFDAASTRLASGDQDNVVHVWDPIKGGSPQVTFRLNDEESPNSLAFNPAGTILAADDGKDVVLWDVRNANNASELRRLKGHTNVVSGVAWHPNGSILASGANDSTVKLWDVATGNLLHTFQQHSDWVNSVSFDSHGRYLASASDDNTVRLFDASTLSYVRAMQGHKSWVQSVAFSPDGAKLASGSRDGRVRIWRARNGASLGVYSVGSDVNSVAWSPDGQFLVTGSEDGIVRIWDANKDGGKPILRLKGHSDEVWSVAWSSNGKLLASGSSDSMVKVWEVSSA